jgi:hypothetical protein
MTRGLTSPTVDGSSTSAEFKIGGSTAYSNGYWWRSNDSAPTAPVKTLVYDFYIYVPASSAKAPQAIEFECQQEVNGHVYNFAWQADYPTHYWRTFDYINRQWVASSIPFTGFTPDTWHHVIAEYHASGTTAVHDALTVDGVRTVVNISRPAKSTSSTGHYLTNAFQLDMNRYATGFNVYVDKMNVTFQ